jgi:hypothetical protein
MSALTDLGVAGIRDGFRSGDFSAREVADSFNAAVAGAKSLNAFIVETPEHAIAAAEQADRDRSSGGLKPLSGVPIGMKDLFCTKGVQTTAGSHILEGFVPEYESTVSARLWAAGAGMLGKLNMDQFAMGSSNETSYFGNVISPWKRRDGGNAPLAPGGSSARQRLAPILAGRSVNRRHSLAFRGSSQPMAAVRAGVWLPLRPRLIRQAQWRVMCGIARSCWRIWRGLIPRIQPRSNCQCRIGRRVFQPISGANASVSPRNIALIICPVRLMRCGNRA